MPVSAPDLPLRRRALLACDLIADAYRGEWAPPVRVLDHHSHKGVEVWCVERAGALWLVVPGSDEARDWVRNAASQIPWRWARRAVATAGLPEAQVPFQGKSGRWWGLGFLRGADIIHDRLEQTGITPAFTAGHSLGAAMAQILRWSRDVGETHALAPPRVRFGGESEPPVPDLHCWISRADTVCDVPFGARHVGIEHVLPDLRRLGEEHRVRWYRQRLAQEIARLQALEGQAA